ncbi:hypothetical protein DFH94DRAFT_71575 [Russula ochroleuca]|uniref:Uncharacterized protein n=1 Tax=Russula ochroleuca TaxID=152965 RepID=A0A9P5MSX4_9AGAM|nr:hypothetical protein DFH94DRAFT_71575 [Russula ochroleuca]
MHNASSPSCTPRSCGSSPLQDRSPTKKWPQMFSTSSGHIASCAQAALQLLPSPSPTLRIRCHIRGYSRYRHWHRRGRRLQLWCHSQPSLRERRKRRTAIAQLGPDAFLPVVRVCNLRARDIICFPLRAKRVPASPLSDALSVFPFPRCCQATSPPIDHTRPHSPCPCPAYSCSSVYQLFARLDARLVEIGSGRDGEGGGCEVSAL